MEEQDTISQTIVKQDSLAEDSMVVSGIQDLHEAQTENVITESISPKPKADFTKNILFKSKKEIDTLENSASPFWTYLEQPKIRQGIVGKQKISVEYGFLLIPILIIGLLLTRIRPLKNKKLFQYLNAAVSNRFFRQIIREEEAVLNPTGVLLFIIYFLSTSLLAFNAFIFFSKGVPTSVAFKFYLITAIVVFGLFVLKSIGIWLSINLFKSTDNLETYHFQFLLFTKVLGLLLIIPAALSSFGFYQLRETFVFLGLTIYGLMFALRIGKSLLIGIGSNLANWQYIILYICTLEIVPLVIIVKTLRI